MEAEPSPPAVKKSKKKKKHKKRRVDSPLVKAVKVKLRAAAYTSKGMDFARLFKHYDRDNSGALDFNEFRSAIRRDAKITANQVSDTELKRVFSSVDDDGGGEVEIDEFVEWLGLNKAQQHHRHKSKHHRHGTGRGREEDGEGATGQNANDDDGGGAGEEEEGEQESWETSKERRDLDAARERLWEDVLAVPEDLLSHVSGSHLKQRLDNIAKVCCTRVPCVSFGCCAVVTAATVAGNREAGGTGKDVAVSLAAGVRGGVAGGGGGEGGAQARRLGR